MCGEFVLEKQQVRWRTIERQPATTKNLRAAAATHQPTFTACSNRMMLVPHLRTMCLLAYLIGSEKRFKIQTFEIFAHSVV